MSNALLRSLCLISGLILAFVQLASGETAPTSNAESHALDRDFVANWHPLSVLSKLGSVTVRPNWIGEGPSFWYQYKTTRGTQYWYVNPAAGSKTPLFNHDSMSIKIQELSNSHINALSLEFQDISVSEGGGVVEFSHSGTHFVFNTKESKLTEIPHVPPKPVDEWRNTSPDGTLSLYVQGNNLYLTRSHGDAEIHAQLTSDGAAEYSWGTEWNIITDKDTSRHYVDGYWSQDSRFFAVLRADLRSVASIPIVDYLYRPRPQVTNVKYPFPCDTVPQWELWVYDSKRDAIHEIEIARWPDQTFEDLTCETMLWSRDSRTLYVIRKSRDHHSVDVCAVDAESGKCQTLIEERMNCQVFIHPLVEIPESGELLWWSMKDGRGHYYLYSAAGELTNQVTTGAINALEVVYVDSDEHHLYFLAHKDKQGSNPYLKFLYRVGLNGQGLTLLTPEEANHVVSYCPSGGWCIDNFSRVDLPTTSVLRNSDGDIVLNLEEADISGLKQAGWRPPIIFSAIAADGVTDLWGMMELPHNLDTAMAYPVIARVYPGRQTEALPSTFWPVSLESYLAQYGFIVLQFGNRGGSPHRGLDYWQFGRDDFRDYGLEDKKAVIKQLGERYSFIDTDKVGIFGGSSGGFMTVAAMLVCPDVFDVGVAMTAPNDPGLYYNTWFERYNGCSSETNTGISASIQCDIPTCLEIAENLNGNLLLIYGTQDDRTHLSQLFTMADALITAGKHFDMFVIPGVDHSLGDWGYRFSLICKYFVEHLGSGENLGVNILLE